jgi:hypothetical protein
MEWMTPTEKSGGVDRVLPRCAGSLAANTIVSVQVPPTLVGTMYLRVISLIGFRYRSMLRGSDDENYGRTLCHCHRGVLSQVRSDINSRSSFILGTSLLVSGGRVAWWNSVRHRLPCYAAFT